MISAAIKRHLPACAVLLLGGAVLWHATDRLRALTEEGARRLHAREVKPEMPAFVLEDMNGQALHLGRQEGSSAKATLVSFIYTTCPTICQTAGSDASRLRDGLKRLQLDGAIRLVSLSFDPRRDDPQQMRIYAELHGADGTVWTIARPRPGDVRKITESFGVRIIPDGWGGYQHNSAIHIIDTDGRLTGIFDTDDIDGVLAAISGLR